MDVIYESLTHQSGPILLVLCGLAVLLCYDSLKQHAVRRNFDRKWGKLLQGVRGENLEHLLERHLLSQADTTNDIQDLRRRVEVLEKRLDDAKTHLGLLNFDAFDEVSGNQSFAMALYDDQGNGMILSSLVGRSDCRVYCKSLVNGRSERSLTREEQRAIREALNTTGRTIVSP